MRADEDDSDDAGLSKALDGIERFRSSDYDYRVLLEKVIDSSDPLYQNACKYKSPVTDILAHYGGAQD